MLETILNIYLIIKNNYVVEFRAVAYEKEGEDEKKIRFLKSKVHEDFSRSYHFNAPSSRTGSFMKYNKFAKLEERGMHFQLFEEIFSSFNVPEKPLICVTPVVDGIILAGD
jgi:hypothetical protein